MYIYIYVRRYWPRTVDDTYHIQYLKTTRLSRKE